MAVKAPTPGIYARPPKPLGPAGASKALGLKGTRCVAVDPPTVALEYALTESFIVILQKKWALAVS